MPVCLELSSRAHFQGNEETALDIYLAALDNPATAEDSLARCGYGEGCSGRSLWRSAAVAVRARDVDR